MESRVSEQAPRPPTRADLDQQEGRCTETPLGRSRRVASLDPILLVNVSISGAPLAHLCSCRDDNHRHPGPTVEPGVAIRLRAHGRDEPASRPSGLSRWTFGDATGTLTCTRVLANHTTPPSGHTGGTLLSNERTAPNPQRIFRLSGWRRAISLLCTQRGVTYKEKKGPKRSNADLSGSHGRSFPQSD